MKAAALRSRWAGKDDAVADIIPLARTVRIVDVAPDGGPSGILETPKTPAR